MAAEHNHWSQGLLADIADPSTWLYANAKVIAVKDKYPKAMFHFLVMPRENIPSIFKLRQSHLDLLDAMFEMALHVVEEVGRGQEFKIGYHAEPSMQQLHLHVISTDFNSKNLKRPRHWTSFNTCLFMCHHEVVELIQQFGYIEKLDADVIEEIRNAPLKCHRCPLKLTSIYALKKHMLVHLECGQFD